MAPEKYDDNDPCGDAGEPLLKFKRRKGHCCFVAICVTARHVSWDDLALMAPETDDVRRF
jgi:hypothetical protein